MGVSMQSEPRSGRLHREPEVLQITEDLRGHLPSNALTNVWQHRRAACVRACVRASPPTRLCILFLQGYPPFRAVTVAAVDLRSVFQTVCYITEEILNAQIPTFLGKLPRQNPTN